jgi:hypothetical protein
MARAQPWLPPRICPGERSLLQASLHALLSPSPPFGARLGPPAVPRQTLPEASGNVPGSFLVTD